MNALAAVIVRDVVRHQRLVRVIDVGAASVVERVDNDAVAIGVIRIGSSAALVDDVVVRDVPRDYVMERRPGQIGGRWRVARERSGDNHAETRALSRASNVGVAVRKIVQKVDILSAARAHAGLAVAVDDVVDDPDVMAGRSPSIGAVGEIHAGADAV